MRRTSLPPELESGLVLFYPEYPNSGTSVFDVSGTGNAGTLVNTPTKVRGGAYGYEGFGFNGSNTYITSPATWNFVDDVSFAVTVNLNVINTTSNSFFGRQQNTGYALLLHRSDRSCITLQYAGNGSIEWVDWPADTNVANKKMRIGFSKSGTTIRKYLNGAYVGSTTVVAGENSVQPVSFGALYFSGSYGNYGNNSIWNPVMAPSIWSDAKFDLDAKAFFIP